MAKDYRKLCTSDSRNCTVVAISKALAVPMEVAYEAMENAGRKHGDGAYMHTVKQAVESLGGEVISQLSKRIQLETRLNTKFTVRSIGEWFSTGRYIMATSDHAFAVLHGTVDDFTSDSKYHVHEVFEIIGAK